jgi:hypothetical protein
MRAFDLVRRLKPRSGPIYTARISDSDWQDLGRLLAEQRAQLLQTGRSLDPGVCGCFCLWVAEWWRRCHEGGPWKWEEALRELDMLDLAPMNPGYPRLQKIVDWGLCALGRPLLETGRGRAFLLTLAVEGGLPLRLLRKENAALRRFFRVVFDECRRVGSMRSERDVVHDLKDRLVQSLRQDVMLELVGELATQVRRLQRAIPEGSDPVAHLDRESPGWRDTLPLRIDDDTARDFLTGLLREARDSERRPAPTLHLQRGLVRDEAGCWHLQAELVLPGSLQDSELTALGWMPDSDRASEEARLPSRFFLTWSASGQPGRDVARATRRDAGFVIERLTGRETVARTIAGPQRRQTISARDLRGACQPLHLLGGEALSDDLPWVFVRDDPPEEPPTSRDTPTPPRRLILVGEGSVRTRAASAFVLLPQGATIVHVDDAASPPVQVGTDASGRILSQIRADARVTSAGEDYDVLLARARDPRSFTLMGRPVPGLSDCFAGAPHLRVERAGHSKDVPPTELQFRPRGRRAQWQEDASRARGEVELRYDEPGEAPIRARARVLSATARVRYSPPSPTATPMIELSGFGSRDEVDLMLTEGSCFSIAADGGETTIRAHAAVSLPASVALSVRWRRTPFHPAWIDLTLPVPRATAFFRRTNGDPLAPNEIVAIEELASIHLEAFSSDPRARTLLTLRPMEPTSVDSHKIRGSEEAKYGPPYLAHDPSGRLDFPMAQLHDDIHAALASSEEIDTRITVSVELDGVPVRDARFEVRRYDRELDPEKDGTLRLAKARGILGPPPDATRMTIEARPFFAPDAEPFRLALVDGRVVIPDEMRSAGEIEPLLITGREGDWYRLRPRRYPRGALPRPAADVANFLESRLGAKFASIAAQTAQHERREAYAGELALMALDLERPEWDLVVAELRWLERVPPSCLDLFVAMARAPAAAAALPFRLDETALRLFWASMPLLPFDWRFIPIPMWRNAARNHQSHLEDQLARAGLSRAQAESLAHDTTQQRLTWIAQRLERPWMATPDDAPRMCALPPYREARLAERDNARRQLDRDAACDNRGWPRATLPSLDLNLLPADARLTRRPHEGSERDSVLDAPLVAALAVVTGRTLTPKETATMLRLRAFHAQWFDEAFESTLLLALSLGSFSTPEVSRT